MKEQSSEDNEVYFKRPSLRWPVILIPSWLLTTGYSVYYYLLLTLAANVIDNRLRTTFVLLVSINGVITYLLIGYTLVFRKIAAKNLLLDLLGDYPGIVVQRFNRWSVRTEYPVTNQSGELQLLKRLKHKDILEVLERHRTKKNRGEPFK